MVELPDLTAGQYSLVYNAMSLTIAAFLSTFVFFLVGTQFVAPKYRKALVTSALVVGIAAYHYFRISFSWEAAFTLEGGTYVASGKPFNDAYRYVDWLITVPLLLVELVQVMNISKEKARNLITVLSISAVLMIVTGYPGEVAPVSVSEGTNTSLFSTRGLWGFISTIFFTIILVKLVQEIWGTAKEESGQIRVLIRNTLLLTVAVWGFYPIAYMGPFFGLSGAGGEVFVQVGYSLADIIAKAGYGLLIFTIARERTAVEQPEGTPQAA
jgi:bacteriorhodopsin